MVRYSAGIVTAYGAAKRAGYTGTYEDFCRQQAEYAESAAAVEQAKTTAVNAAATATTKAGEATTAATAAQTAKAQTEQAASQAQTDISTAKATALSGIDTAKSTAVSAVQSEGQTQTTNARAQAQAASQSAAAAQASAATAGAAKALAEAAATNAATSATNAATSATNAAQSASDAQAVLESIPEDYSDLSEDVDKLKADLDTSAIISSGIDVVTTNYSSYSDANEAPLNKIIHFKNTITKAMVSNLPAYGGGGTLITFSYIKSAVNTKCQFYITWDNVLFTRVKTSGTWTVWRDISTKKLSNETVLNIINAVDSSGVQVNESSDVVYDSDTYIDASGQFVSVNYPIALSDYIPVNYGKFYTIQIDSVLGTRHTTRNLRIHAYGANKQWIKPLKAISLAKLKETEVIDVAPDEESIKYLRFSVPVVPTLLDNEDRITKVTFFEVNQLFTSGISDYLRYGLHTVPPSEGAFNAIKRARLLTDAKWTPVANLPRTMRNTGDGYLESHGASYQGQFAADKQYEGMPYSYTYGTPRYIGINEPIDLFYSCLTNQNSVLYTNSAYSGLSAVYYGITCSTVVGYALDIPNIDSNYHSKIKGMQKLYDLVTSGVRHDINDMKIGDVLFQATHVAMVGDIIKDGINVTDIEILEGTRQGCTDKTVLNSELGGVARRFWMTTDEFFAWFDGFALYRYKYIDSVKFVRNPYVPLVYGEKSMPTRYFPCMPFYGNRKVFTSNENGDTVRVLIHDTNYTHIIVYKDGVQYGVYEITGLSYVDVNCEYGEAEYSANLITYDNENQINAKSIACYWYMMPEYDFTVIDDESYHHISVTVRKGNFIPWYVTFKSSATENNPAGFTIVKSSYEVSTSGDMTTYTFSVEKDKSDSNVCILALQSIKYAYFKLQKTY